MESDEIHKSVCEVKEKQRKQMQNWYAKKQNQITSCTKDSVTIAWQTSNVSAANLHTVRVSVGMLKMRQESL